MAILRKGTAIGITDSAYNSIRVGDTLKNIHSGLLATVNKYGQFVCNITGDKLGRDGSNWIVVDDDAVDLDFDLDYKVGQEEAQAVTEIPEIPAAPTEKDEDAGVDPGVHRGAEGLGGYDTAEILAEAKKRADVLSYFTEDEIFAELRSRGFSGSLDREIRIIKNYTI